jgi:LysR family nitrogen assimilation transcriptional regulator
MELRQLRYLVGIAEAGGVLAASKTLHVAQPALSYHVASLEQELGVILFTRSHRGMTLTDAGRTVVEHARVVLQDVERVTTAVREGRGEIRGDVVVGLPTTVALVATLPILQAARDRYPGIRLKLIESHSGFLGEWLQSGRLDLSFLFAGSGNRGIAEQPLLEERLVFVTRLPLAARRGIGLKAVTPHPLVLPARGHGLRRIVDDACVTRGVELNVVAEIDSLPNIKKAVEAGFAATILSPGAVAEEVAEGRLAMCPIGGPPLLRTVVCATSLTRPATTAGTAIIELATDVMQRLVATKAWPARWIA